MSAERGGGGRGGAPGGGAPGGGRRGPHVRPTKAKTDSSRRWLERQLNDPYVADARRLGYRSRAAFKLVELDDRLKFLKPGARVVDLGAAPGGWTQIAVERVGRGGQVVAVDLQAMDPVAGASFLEMDFMEDEAPARIRALLSGPVDVVLSDMAAPSTGHANTDHLRIMGLAETAFQFAREILAPGGSFVAKVLQGGTERELLAALKRDFRDVRHIKPPASRADSAEIYVIALGFRGRDDSAVESAAG
ncbi:MAG: RlmE family RNA methyltransferase [Rhodospirillaceae bacterium]|nr:RlmE family RNA methyltransferase [Rhodospirillaceae bacterium]